MRAVVFFIKICLGAIFACNAIASPTSGHVLSSRSDPSVRDRLPKIEMNATSHSIVMTLHPATIIDASIRRFRLQYGINFPYQHTIYIDKDQKSVLINKLEPNQKYIFSLITLNENNDTVIPEQFYDFQMPSEDDDRQPPKTPLELNIIPRSKTAVLLQWTDVDYPKNAELPSSRRYKVQFSELGAEHRVVKQQEMTAGEQSLLIDNLKPLTNYEFAVRAIDGDLESDYSMAVEYSSAVYPVKQFNMITNSDPLKVTLTWEPPDDADGIASYIIYYAEQEGDREGPQQRVTVPDETIQTTISQLKPNTKYFFKIVSANQFNDESIPETKLYKTPNVVDTKVVESNNSTQQNLLGWSTMLLSNHSWLLIVGILGLVLVCIASTSIVVCCCRSSNKKKHLHHGSPLGMNHSPHQRQYSATSNTASSSLLKPTDLWAGADCLSPPVPTATIRTANGSERHYDTSLAGGTGTLQRCNHHHQHPHYLHSPETQPLTSNNEMNMTQQRHSYVPSNDGSSSIDGGGGFSTNGKFNNSMRTRPIAVGGSGTGTFEQQQQTQSKERKSMKNLPMGTAFIMNHNSLLQQQNPQQQQHVTVRPIQQKAQYIVRPSEPHSIGSGPSSPDYQHSPSNSHCSSNHNPPSTATMAQSTTLGMGSALYDKLAANGNNQNLDGGVVSNNPRAMLSSKPNLRSFTVPVAPPIIPPPPVPNKQQANIAPITSQYKSPFRSPNRAMLNAYNKDLKIIPNNEIDTNPADVLEDVRNQLGNLMKKDFQC